MTTAQLTPVLKLQLNMKVNIKKFHLSKRITTQVKVTLFNRCTFLSTDYLIVHDADLEYFPEDIVEMYKEAIKLPESLIIGSRVNGDKERTNIYYSTYLGNKIFAYIFSIVNHDKALRHCKLLLVNKSYNF